MILFWGNKNRKRQLPSSYTWMANHWQFEIGFERKEQKIILPKNLIWKIISWREVFWKGSNIIRIKTLVFCTCTTLFCFDKKSIPLSTNTRTFLIAKSGKKLKPFSFAYTHLVTYFSILHLLFFYSLISIFIPLPSLHFLFFLSSSGLFRSSFSW